MLKGDSLSQKFLVPAISLKKSRNQGFLFWGVKKAKKEVYVILYSYYLYIYADDGGIKPRFVLPLSKYNKVAFSGINEFTLMNTNDKYVKPVTFRAELDHSAEKWMEDIKTIISQVNDNLVKYGYNEERIEYFLYIKINEVSGLPMKMDTYVTVSIDGVQKNRTSTVVNDKMPIFGQEFEIDLNEHDTLFSVGLLNEKREELGGFSCPLNDYYHEELSDFWHPLEIQNPDRVLPSGELHVDITIENEKVYLNFVEARNVFCFDEYPSPYLKIVYGTHEITTGVIKKSDCPLWNTHAEWDITTEVIRFEIWNKNTPGGVVQIRLQQVRDSPNQLLDDWFEFQTDHEQDNIGKMRLSVQWKQSIILHDRIYENLLILLLSSEMMLIKKLDIIVYKQETLLSESLVKALHVKKSSIHFIKGICDHEIRGTTDPSLIFRGNTVATKSVDVFLRLIGETYVKHVLQDIFEEIAHSKKSCELDPYRLEGIKPDKHDKILKRNLENLIYFCDKIFMRIISSLDYCPSEFRIIFQHIQNVILDHFGEDGETRYRGPSGFIFLRFFCPALLNATKFEITTEQPTPFASRNLTLIVITLQNLANLVEFGRKDPFMVPANDFIFSKKQEFKLYIDELCSTPEYEADIPKPELNINFGREMSRIHYHFCSTARIYEEKLGNEDDLVVNLLLSLNEINQKLREQMEITGIVSNVYNHIFEEIDAILERR